MAIRKTSCKCGREIFFGHNPATNKKVPLVAKPITAFVVDEAVMIDGCNISKPVRVYVSHFGDCPLADKFRKPKPKGEPTDG
jgi:hypothetical protein